MHALHALTQGIEFSTFLDGEMAVKVPTTRTAVGWQWVRVPGESLDAMIARGWVVLVGSDELEVTDQGVYHVRRWCGEQERAARRQRRAG